MLTRILNGRILLRNNHIVYFFSKDPFEKFNRKGQKQANNKKNIVNDASKINKPVTESGQKQEQKDTTTNFQRNEAKEHNNEPKYPKGFQKFARKQQKYARQQKKQSDEPKEATEQNKKQASENSEKQQHQEHNHHQNTNNNNHQTAHKAFEKFVKKNPLSKQKISQEKIKVQNKKQIPSKMEKQIKKQAKVQNKKQEKPQQKKQSKAQQGKKASIPRMYVEIDENEDIDTVVLRKPRRNKIIHPSLSPIVEPQPQPKPEPEPEREPEQEPEREPEPEPEPERDLQNAVLNSQKQKEIEQQQQQRRRYQQQQKKKWQQFQSLVSQIKNRIITTILRYQRMGLIKKPTDHTKNNKEKKPEKEVPIDLKNYLAFLMGAGFFLFSFSSSKYQFFEDSELVDPQYMKNAFESKTIQETWIKRVDVITHNDQITKGKNYKNFIYIREKNGKVSSCISNEDFQKLWFDQVTKYNYQVDLINSQTLKTNQQQRGTEKIIILQNVEIKKNNLSADIRSTLSLLLLLFFIRSIISLTKGGKGNAGKGGFSGAMDDTKSYRLKEAIKVTFKDVVGMQKSKDEIVQFIDFLKHPEKYNKLGARIPTGALLTGPPGTGKTMIAKACAGESKVPFYSISGSQFIEMYVGVGAQRVRSLFKQAKNNAPSIIFIDEIDAVGKKRSGMGGGGNDERDTTLNQLLVEMDGFDKTTNVIVFAATNQKQVLDPALTRPGRFDRLIEVDLPDLQGRKQIFEVHLKPLRLEANADVKEYSRRLATLTPGFSGADIKNVCNEAAIIAARSNKQAVTIIDFQLATERIIGGVEKKSQLITPQTRKIVAYHECGHGVVSWFIENASPLLKLTIIPRSKGALGFAQYLPNQHQIYTKKKLLDQISVILGGRIAEQIFFGKISTGASDDLNKAYQIAKSYVTKFGFGDRLGWIQYDETEYAKQYSREVQNKIDSEIMEIMIICSNRTRAIVQNKKDLIHNLAEKLLQLQTIDQSIIQNILGPRPFKLSKQHEEYIKQKKKMSEEVLGLQQKKIEQLPLQMKRVDHIL